MIKNLPLGGLTFCAISEGLQVGQGKAKKHIIILKTPPNHFTSVKASVARMITAE